MDQKNQGGQSYGQQSQGPDRGQQRQGEEQSQQGRHWQQDQRRPGAKGQQRGRQGRDGVSNREMDSPIEQDDLPERGSTRESER